MIWNEANLMIELEILREENRDLRKRLEAANRIIGQQVADAAQFIAEHYTRKDLELWP